MKVALRTLAVWCGVAGGIVLSAGAAGCGGAMEQGGSAPAPVSTGAPVASGTDAATESTPESNGAAPSEGGAAKTTAGSSTAAAAKSTSTAAAPAAAQEAIGVAECDDYVSVMEICLTKIDPAARAATATAFQQTRDAWRAAAKSGGAARDALRDGCLAALNAVPASCGK